MSGSACDVPWNGVGCNMTDVISLSLVSSFFLSSISLSNLPKKKKILFLCLIFFFFFLRLPISSQVPFPQSLVFVQILLLCKSLIFFFFFFFFFVSFLVYSFDSFLINPFLFSFFKSIDSFFFPNYQRLGV